MCMCVCGHEREGVCVCCQQKIALHNHYIRDIIQHSISVCLNTKTWECYIHVEEPLNPVFPHCCNHAGSCVENKRNQIYSYLKIHGKTVYFRILWKQVWHTFSWFQFHARGFLTESFVKIGFIATLFCKSFESFENRWYGCGKLPLCANVSRHTKVKANRWWLPMADPHN